MKAAASAKMLANSVVLPELLADCDIKLVDIGGRGGTFSTLRLLAPFSSYYISEPDPEEATRLEHELQGEGAWRAAVVIREAIATCADSATLYVTRSPGMSSLFEPDSRVADRFCLASKFEVVSTMAVPTITLDTAASRYGFANASFVKLDTQGTELDILRSGPGVLASAVAVHTEASFHPFYQGQPLFADLDCELRNRGFSLVSLSRTNLRRAGYDASLYSRRTVAWAHCLYVREPDSLAARGQLERDVPRSLAVALAFQHYDLAFELVALARSQHLFSPALLDALAAELNDIATDATRHVLKAGRIAAARLESAAAESLLAPAYRDKKQIE